MNRGIVSSSAAGPGLGARSGYRVWTNSVSRSDRGRPDDIFYDSATRQLFVSCGAGFLDVLGTAASGQFTKVAKTATAPGARTAFYVPTLRRPLSRCSSPWVSAGRDPAYEAVR